MKYDLTVIIPVYNTEKYLRAVDSLKKQAIDSLPKLEF